MSATTDYQADVTRRGWLYLPQLPANTPLGLSVDGAPGARLTTWTMPADGSPWKVKDSRYELAPLAVRIEQGFTRTIQAIEDAAALQNLKEVEGHEKQLASVKNALVTAAEVTGLDHGAAGLVAKAIGIPPWLLLVVLIVVGYAVLRQYGIVPPIKKVIS